MAAETHDHRDAIGRSLIVALGLHAAFLGWAIHRVDEEGSRPSTGSSEARDRSRPEIVEIALQGPLFQAKGRASSAAGKDALHGVATGPQRAPLAELKVPTSSTGTAAESASPEADQGAAGISTTAGGPGSGRSVSEDAKGKGSVPSLEALGIGSPRAYSSMPFSRPQPKSAEQRLNRSLAQGVVARDRLRGIGSHGAIISALESSARTSALPTEGQALFLAVIDGGGRLRVLDVLETNGARDSWERLARTASAGLGARRFSVPSGTNGLELTIRIVTRTQLPSGADPGLGVSALGIPLKRGKGKKSPSIDILKPRFKVGSLKLPGHAPDDEIPTVEVGVDVLNIGVDPADIGASTSRVLRAEVVRERVL